MAPSDDSRDHNREDQKCSFQKLPQFPKVALVGAWTLLWALTLIENTYRLCGFSPENQACFSRSIRIGNSDREMEGHDICRRKAFITI